MPNYEFEFVGASGRQRSTFTLDDDLPLGPQVGEILAELNASGVMLEGGPDDRPAIHWDGEELDPSRTPSELALSNVRSLEIVMVSPTEAFDAVTIDGPPPRFFPRGAYGSSLLGFVGGLGAWVVVTLVTDLGGTVTDYARLDTLSTGLLGMFVGALVLMGAALRSDGVPLEGGVSGIVLGAVGGVVGGELGVMGAMILAEQASFAVGRILAWMVAGLFIGLFLGIRFWFIDRLRILDGAIWGGLSGGLAGCALLLPGATDFWHAIAFCLTGFGVGLGLVWPGQRRAWGLLELEMKDGRSVGLLSVREWIVSPGSRRTVAQSVAIECDGVECVARATGPDQATVEGRPLPAVLHDADRLILVDARYVFRRLRGSA